MEGTVLVDESKAANGAAPAGRVADGARMRMTVLPERRSARNAARIPPVAQLRLGWQERAACQGSDARLFFGPEKERIRDRGRGIRRPKERPKPISRSVAA